jgi:hypothetical protein
LIGKAGLLRKAFGSEIVGVSFGRYSPDGDIPFRDQIFQIRVYKAESQIKFFAQISLRKRFAL